MRLKWLPRVFTNTLAIERELEKGTQLIYLKVFPVEITAVTMATSHLMTGKYVPNFGLNSLTSTISFGEIDIAKHFESVKTHGCSDGFPNILQFIIFLNILDQLRQNFTKKAILQEIKRKCMWLQLRQVLKNSPKETGENLLSVFLFVLMSTSSKSKNTDVFL